MRISDWSSDVCSSDLIRDLIMVGRVEVFIVKGLGPFIADKMEGEWSAQSAKGRQCAALYVLPDIWLPVVDIDLIAISPNKPRHCSRAIRWNFVEHCFIESDAIDDLTRNNGE